MATAEIWASTETFSAMIAAPPSAPTTVPRLQPAWKRGIIARPSCCSTSAPWTFIAISHVLVPMPYANSPTTTGATPIASPTATVAKPAPARTAPAATVRREPKRFTMGPDKGSAMTAPTAAASRTGPRLPGSRPSCSFTCGIRDAQLAKAKPLPPKAKYAARAATSTSLGPGAFCSRQPSAPRLEPLHVTSPNSTQSSQCRDCGRPGGGVKIGYAEGTVL
jgi:hypothetical protein